MDILNFISWLKAGKYSTTAPIDAVTVIGVPNTTRGDAYLPATVPISALQTNIGKLMGGGIVVSEWIENGIHKALVASLTDLGPAVQWTESAYQVTSVPGGAVSPLNGFTNTNNIILQTTVAATTTYAAGVARLHNGGDYNDWYLPSLWELYICYNVAAIVNKVLGSINGFAGSGYWSSTENGSSLAWVKYFNDSLQYSGGKFSNYYVRAVRIHTL
jgi:hypothetical protein